MVSSDSGQKNFKRGDQMTVPSASSTFLMREVVEPVLCRDLCKIGNGRKEKKEVNKLISNFLFCCASYRGLFGTYFIFFNIFLEKRGVAHNVSHDCQAIPVPPQKDTTTRLFGIWPPFSFANHILVLWSHWKRYHFQIYFLPIRAPLSEQCSLMDKNIGANRD